MRLRYIVPIAIFILLFVIFRPKGVGQRTAARVPSQTPLASGNSSASPSPTVAAPITVASPLAPTTAPEPAPPQQPIAAPPTQVPAPLPSPTPTFVSMPTELPELVAELAPPTPDVRTPTVVLASQPRRLLIPALGLDLAPVPVGVDERRIPIVPRHDVGWFTSSAMPGQGSNVVFWGHVLRWKDTPNIPAPFARVHELKLGDEIIVATSDQEHRYRITRQVQVKPEDVQYVYPTNTEQVTLVSCIGDKVIQNGTLTMELRLVTIAERVP